MGKTIDQLVARRTRMVERGLQMNHLTHHERSVIQKLLRGTGVSIVQILGGFRTSRVARVRRELIIGFMEAFPHYSAHRAAGKLGCHHATVLRALSAVEKGASVQPNEERAV